MDTRKSTIIEMLKGHEELSVKDLAERFVVSEMTIRRDFDELERQGYLVRTHGGAVPTGRLRFIQANMMAGGESTAKTSIGKAAAKLVQPGQTIMLDTGTTALEVARHLPQDAGITVATTSLCVAQELYDTGITILLLGGFLRKEFPSVYGPLTEKLLNDIQVDAVFMGCDGASSETGFYTNDLHISSLEQAMIRIAHRVIIITESVKLGQRAFSRFATIQQVHTIVTDSNLSSEDRANLEAQGISIIFAGNT